MSQHPASAKKIRDAIKSGKHKETDLVIPLVQMTAIGFIFAWILKGSHYGHLKTLSLFVNGSSYVPLVSVWIMALATDLYWLLTVGGVTGVISVLILWCINPYLFASAKVRIKNPFCLGAFINYCGAVKKNSFSIIKRFALGGVVSFFAYGHLLTKIDANGLGAIDSQWSSHFIFCFSTLGLAALLLHIWYRHKKFHKTLMMTTQQVRDEHKEENGDPHMRQKRHEMCLRGIHEDLESRVKKAKVVIVNYR